MSPPYSSIKSDVDVIPKNDLKPSAILPANSFTVSFALSHLSFMPPTNPSTIDFPHSLAAEPKPVNVSTSQSKPDANISTSQFHPVDIHSVTVSQFFQRRIIAAMSAVIPNTTHVIGLAKRVAEKPKTDLVAVTTPLLRKAVALVTPLIAGPTTSKAGPKSFMGSKKLPADHIAISSLCLSLSHTPKLCAFASAKESVSPSLSSRSSFCRPSASDVTPKPAQNSCKSPSAP